MACQADYRGFESRRVRKSCTPVVWFRRKRQKSDVGRFEDSYFRSCAADAAVCRRSSTKQTLPENGYRGKNAQAKSFLSACACGHLNFRPSVLYAQLPTVKTLSGGIHMFKKIIIQENEKGLLFQNGKYMKLLGAGKYYTFSDREIEVVNAAEPLASDRCALDILLADAAVAKQVSVVEVADEQLALHFVNGKFADVLRHGKYAFWEITDRHTYQMVDIADPSVDASVPTYIFSKIPSFYYIRIDVAEYQKARLYFNQKFQKILEAGTYYFWRNSVKVDVGFVDTRLTQMDITGQEILTRDKVSLRVNFVCNYRVTDYVKILTEIDDFEEQMHVAAQLALREYVGKYKLDEILENKDGLSQYVFENLKAKESTFFVEIVSAGVKDIILPGEIRDIMNTVLIAEKRAQANVISRREEVASTRSLLNTAKLMEENQTLYKLKELEFIERICENVGNITLNGSGDVLSQLAGLFKEQNAS